VTLVIGRSIYTTSPLGAFNFLVVLSVSIFLAEFRLGTIARFGTYFVAFFSIYSVVFYASDFVELKWGYVLIVEDGAFTASSWVYISVASLLLAIVPTFFPPVEPKALM
jgi:hypothetical protein